MGMRGKDAVMRCRIDQRRRAAPRLWTTFGVGMV